MAEETGLDERLADLAADGRLGAVPLAAEQIRARGDRRRRRKRAARASGGVLLAAAVVVGGLSLVRPGPEPTAADPNPSTSAPLFVPPTPAPGRSTRPNSATCTARWRSTGAGYGSPSSSFATIGGRPCPPVWCTS